MRKRKKPSDEYGQQICMLLWKTSYPASYLENTAVMSSRQSPSCAFTYLTALCKYNHSPFFLINFTNLFHYKMLLSYICHFFSSCFNEIEPRACAKQCAAMNGGRRSRQVDQQNKKYDYLSKQYNRTTEKVGLCIRSHPLLYNVTCINNLSVVLSFYLRCTCCFWV